MTDEEKNSMELDIEAKYVGRTEKEFLNTITYAECLYILDTKNKYCDDIKTLSLLKIVDIVNEQSKEIEELKDMNERQKYRIELVSEDKIEERGDSIDESTMLKQIKSKLDEKNIPIETLLAEFERLEDIEDRKVQIEYNNVFNKGVKSVEDKIKAKIEELENKIKKIRSKKLINEPEDTIVITRYAHYISVLQSLLEKE